MTFRFDPLNNPPVTEPEAEQQLYYFQQLIRSLEAKVARVDPLLVEFDETMDMIYFAKTALKQAAFQYQVIHYKIATKQSGL